MKKEKEVWFIRHAESVGNTGAPTESNESNPLSDKGLIQAQELSNFLEDYPRPDMIILSWYLRAIQTAEPFINKLGYESANEDKIFLRWKKRKNIYQDLLIKTWDVQEFSYLSEEKYKNTSPNDRKNAREEFWKKEDLNFRSDKYSESVCDLIDRAEKTINSIYNLFSPVYPNASDRIYIFSHGQFIKTIMLLLHKANMSDKRGIEISELKNYFDLIEIPNTGIIKIKFEPKLNCLQRGNTWLSSDIGAKSVKENLI